VYNSSAYKQEPDLEIESRPWSCTQQLAARSVKDAGFRSVPAKAFSVWHDSIDAGGGQAIQIELESDNRLVEKEAKIN
jgi:hypothetical protein